MTAPAPARETSRLERRKARTRAAILSAASQLFLKQGFDATSIQQIAELADTGVGTLYGYFESKDDVLREVLREHSVEAVQNYRSGIREDTPSIDKVVRGLTTFSRYVHENRRLLIAAFYVSARDGGAMENSDWLLKSYSQMIQEGIDRGEFKKVPVEATARMLVNAHSNAVLGLGIWREVRDDPQTLKELEALTRALLVP
ncbi:MAG TPA: TetR/AcrR family transcriptional regulator [Tepidiformaceae bacterium]|nr:TetR/AcrR family transcriptional regulator [Tepidiformaceae bacterium]